MPKEAVVISAVFHSGSSLCHTDSTSLGEGVWAGRGKESSRPVDEHQCPARLRPQQRRGQQQRAGTDGGWMCTAWAREARLSGRSSVCRSASNNVSSLSPPAGAASAGLAVALGSGVTATLRRRRRPRPRRELPPSVLAGLAPGRRQRPAHTGGGTRRPPHCRGAERVGQQQRVVGRRPGGRGNGGRRSALISSRRSWRLARSCSAYWHLLRRGGYWILVYLLGTVVASAPLGSQLL